jgi:hypothetical protein
MADTLLLQQHQTASVLVLCFNLHGMLLASFICEIHLIPCMPVELSSCWPVCVVG